MPLLALAYLAYISMALPDGLFGVAWPSMRLTLAAPVSAIGLLLPFGVANSLLSSTVAVANALADRRSDVVVAPAVPYGASGEHQSFPGTVSVGQVALARYLLEMVRSAAVTYRRILLVNGHGGNIEPLRRIAERALYEGRDIRVW